MHGISILFTIFQYLDTNTNLHQFINRKKNFFFFLEAKVPTATKLKEMWAKTLMARPLLILIFFAASSSKEEKTLLYYNKDESSIEAV